MPLCEFRVNEWDTMDLGVIVSIYSLLFECSYAVGKLARELSCLCLTVNQEELGGNRHHLRGWRGRVPHIRLWNSNTPSHLLY